MVKAINYYRPGLNQLAAEIADWRERKGFKTDINNQPEKLLLVHSEVSEACEALRNGDMGGYHEELADILIRVLDICGSLQINIALALSEKMETNERRPYKHGKGF